MIAADVENDVFDLCTTAVMVTVKASRGLITFIPGGALPLAA
jgi:hypothetical protein